MLFIVGVIVVKEHLTALIKVAAWGKLSQLKYKVLENVKIQKKKEKALDPLHVCGLLLNKCFDFWLDWYLSVVLFHQIFLK
jgi:hypothetical protein